MVAIEVSGIERWLLSISRFRGGATLLLNYSKPSSTAVADYASAPERERAVMNDAAWWARVVQARTDRNNLRPQRLWTLHKGEHAAAIDLTAVPGGIGAGIVLTVDGEMRKTLLFRVGAQGGRPTCFT